MANWNQAQLDQWEKNQSEYSDEDEYSDDSDYAPLQINSWGTQTVEEDGTTNVNLTASGWASLIDPSFKVKGNGVGSGQLHRKGNHYIPVDEQIILNQRLGKPVPKGGLPGKKSKSKPKPKPKPQSPYKPSSPALVPPSSSANRTRQPITSGPWATGQLSDTPFWEVPANSSQIGTYASKYASPQPKPTNTPPPVSAPKPVTPPMINRTPTTSTGFQRSSTGSAASKYATTEATKEVRTVNQTVPQPPRPNPEPYLKFDTPVINFNIELTPGVTAKLSVYENDDPVQVVNKFEKDHHLVISDSAKRVFANKVQSLLNQYNTN